MPLSATNNLIKDQIEHSGYLRLLAALRFKDESIHISNTSVPDLGRTADFVKDMRHLETIAICMVTGNKGDVISSAFWRKNDNKSITIVLAKNDAASKDDTRDAKEFLEKLKGPRNQQLRDLVPFLIKRGIVNVQARIEKVRELTQRLNANGVLLSVIEKYCSQRKIVNLRSGLPGRGQHLLRLWELNGIKISDLALQKALKDIVTILTNGLILGNGRDMGLRFELFATAAAALTDSPFFMDFMGGFLSINGSPGSPKRNIIKDETNEFAKFWRNLDKMRLYLRIPDLVKFVREFSEVNITWVSEAIASPKHVKEMNKKIEIPSVPDVALKLAKQSINDKQLTQSLTVGKLEEKLRSCNKFYEQDKSSFGETTSIRPKLHAEIQIVLYMSKLDTIKGERPVGCSKRSCLQCYIVMDLLDSGRWKTAGAHGWPYETAALIGQSQYDSSLRKTIKDQAIFGVHQLLGLKTARPTHGPKRSEDYATASSGSENELELDIIPKLQKLQG